MIHLGIRSTYSFLRGFGTPEQYLERAKQISAPAVAIADFCSTWGHIPFHTAFKDSGVKLILGVQLPVVHTLSKDALSDLVTLIAYDNVGLSAIYGLMSLASEQTYYKPRVTYKQLADLKGHGTIIVNDASLGNLDYLKKLGFGYLGLGPGYSRLIAAADHFECVVSPAVMYPKPEHKQLFELIGAIAAGSRLGEKQFSGYHMLRAGEVRALMPRIDTEWLKNAEAIAGQANASPIRAANIEPSVAFTIESACRAGAERYSIDLKSGLYADRYRRELAVIKQKEFENYFLFVGDLCRWARKRMFVGPARGSSAGSLICYLMGITTVDPLKHGTLFERFIDITRSDWPDIDVDFPDVRRDEVFAYLKNKYGAEKVARLGTISEFGAKSAVKDVGKATGVPYEVTNGLSRLLDHGEALRPVLALDPKTLEQYPALEMAPEIEGHARHHGVHAAGVIVTNEPMTKYVAVDKNGVAAITMFDAERINLIKMDALGLRTLSVISEACEMAKIDADDLYKLSWDDPKVFEIFQKNRVTGVFQFEGQTVRQLMKSMKVDHFDDLCALTSLARPGPLEGGAAALYVQRRSGNEDWNYKHDALEPHTKETFGLIVYQEQAMSIVKDLAGFDDAQVNGFRRAIGKKDPEKLKAFEDQFVPKAKERVGEEIALDLWDEMCEFGSYAFNKSHAVAYSMISYMCAHLKAYHPLEFAVAQLRNAADDLSAKAMLRELKEEGYEYVPFDPDLSDVSWSVIDGKLYGGFTAVRGIGPATARTILDMRRADPAEWKNKLTPAQRSRILAPFNTPWHELSRLSVLFKHLYEDADAHGVAGPVMRVEDIPDKKGNYCFIGTLRKRMLRDMNGPAEIAKRDGQKIEKNAVFLNLIFEDDTGEIGCTINRFKYDAIGAPLMDPGDTPEGRDYLVRGNVINDGRKWLFIEKLRELKSEDTAAHITGRSPTESGAGKSGADADGNANDGRKGLPPAVKQAHANGDAHKSGDRRKRPGDQQARRTDKKRKGAAKGKSKTVAHKGRARRSS